MKWLQSACCLLVSRLADMAFGAAPNAGCHCSAQMRPPKSAAELHNRLVNTKAPSHGTGLALRQDALLHVLRNVETKSLSFVVEAISELQLTLGLHGVLMRKSYSKLCCSSFTRSEVSWSVVAVIGAATCRSGRRLKTSSLFLSPGMHSTCLPRR